MSMFQNRGIKIVAFAAILLVVVVLIGSLFKLTVVVKNDGVNPLTEVYVNVNKTESKCVLGKLEAKQSSTCYPNYKGEGGLGIQFTDSNGVTHVAQEFGPYLEGNPDYIEVRITDTNKVFWTSGSTNTFFRPAKFYESIVIP